MKFKNWDGKGLKGAYLFTVKIDGVQAQRKDGKIVSKGGNPLYNVSDTRDWEVAEIYCGSWNETMSIVRASKSKRRQVKSTEIFPILPFPCKQLRIGVFFDPTKEIINTQFQRCLKAGYEGLVLIPVEYVIELLIEQSEDSIIIIDEPYIKVKPEYTVDIKVTGLVEGKGKFVGHLGKFITDEGEVGTGFTTAERKEFWRKRKQMIGKVIEVLFMEKTINGKMRNPRFKRLREDKS